MVKRILALDVGTVRIGVALSCPLGIIAQPLCTIELHKTDPLVEIDALIAEHEVEAIVVGQPLRLNGEHGPAVLAMEKFLAKLRENIQIPLISMDERFTTKIAERALISGNVRREERRFKRDKVAAAVLLQSYLDSLSGAPSHL